MNEVYSIMGKGIQKFFLIVSGLSFIISGSYGVISLFSNDNQQAKQVESQKAAESKNKEEEKLANVEKGFEKVLEREPNNQFALENLVQIKKDRSDFKGAIDTLEKFIKSNPDNQYALQNLVQLRIARNDFKGAIAPMEKLVKLNPNNPNYKALLAEIKKQATTNTEKKPDLKNTEPKK